ncbi:unnamed protein product [Dovyalis caffra]|uniref:BHLH domain-containing protein n=1 Tax=Dovyalis caffra TaxID=77055 RepID=A0AAV1S947_9ROSI|nr:unnamed protein product [Dovyalis caffra]
MQDVLKVGKEFIQLPADEKQRFYSEDPRQSCKLYTSIDYVKEKVHCMRDNLRHPCLPLQEHVKLWPEKPTQYRKLNIKKTNLPSLMQIISNGRLTSADRSVVTNTKVARTTVGSIINPSSESYIEPAKALTSDCCPQLYKTFVFEDFLHAFIANTSNGISPLERCKLRRKWATKPTLSSKCTNWIKHLILPELLEATKHSGVCLIHMERFKVRIMMRRIRDDALAHDTELGVLGGGGGRMGMGTDLHNTLRSLCFNTDWNYAVFWKLKHRARMVLTWEDGYYENCDQHDALENKSFSQTQENMHGGHYPRDLLGLAVAKMSYHVYSLGEGIVGQVAVSGKHQWIFADKYVASSYSSYEFSDGWQSQLSAGIKTIVVVAVVPYGVVQLGSLNKVIEDMNLVTYIKDVFFALQDSPVGHVTSPLQHTINNALCLKTADELRYKQGALETSTTKNDESIKLLHLRSNASYLDHRSQLGMKIISDQMYGGETNVWKDSGRGSEHNMTTHSNSVMKESVNLSDLILPNEKLGADLAGFAADLFDSTICDRDKSDGIKLHPNAMLKAPESSDITFKNDLEKKLDHQAESTHFNDSDTFFKFSAGCELLEALGPSFMKRCMPFDYQAGKSVAGNIFEMPEEMSSSQMTFDFGSENLLEAVVGNVCHSGSDVKSEKSGCNSVQSLLTAEKMPESSIQTEYIINSAGCSINHSSVVEEDAQNFSNSTEVCGGMSSKGFSSTCPSTCNEQLDKRPEPSKNNKRRAKPNENCRPRPRDRQLIQDRIKELRELVPNGSKCSIDSLLERTIKHMLFLESITKHSDKLNKCAEPKMHQKGTDASNCEQGSSWAVEVGGHLKVSSIIVENLNKAGQMLVEMLCEECSHFLEIAEAIKSLGLTILKGITEVHGEKTWICFVVEGQNNRIMHRMDILWSLVQILQPKNTN